MLPTILLEFLLLLPGAQAPPPGEDFLGELARVQGWSVSASPDGAWRIVHAGVPVDEAAAARNLVARFRARLDAALGAGQPWTREPVTLFLVGSQEAEDQVCAALAEARPHLADWAAAVRVFPRFQHWAPLLALVRQDQAAAAGEPAPVLLAHAFVQLDLCRRRGRMPFWVGEALGYAFQDEVLGEIRAVTFHPGGRLDPDWCRSWRAGAREALLAPDVSVARMIAGSGRSWEETRARLQFGVARWWLDRAPEGLPAFLAALAALRDGTPLDVPFEPPAAEQERLLAAAFGSDWLQAAAAHLAALPAKGGEEGRQEALAAALAGLEAAGVRSWTGAEERVVLHGDVSAREARRVLARCHAALRLLDSALGPAGGGEPLPLLLVNGEGAWQAVGDALAGALPASAPAIRAGTAAGGFTFYAPPVSAWYQDRRVQAEARAENSIVHNLVHLELARRYGELPLWLAEGIACAAEERVFGEVWGTWNRDAFVYTVSHGDWRRSASRAVRRARALTGLYAYTADPFQEEPALLAFAFATYGLEEDRTGFRRLLSDLGAAARSDSGPGRFQPPPAEMAARVAAAFGADFEGRFQHWWRKPPKRPRTR